MFLYVLLSVIHQSWSFRKLKRFIETGEEIVEVAFSFHNLKCEKLNNIYILIELACEETKVLKDN